MITKDNFARALAALGFECKGDRWQKDFATGCTLAADFGRGQLVYPEADGKGLIVNDRTTCNFAHNENFVVFECVCRLLDKGYRAEHIELERRWQLGHEMKGGKADIVVTGEDGDTLLIIECKTAGREYKKAQESLKKDGGQLFSYWKEESRARWLCLYASDFDEAAGQVVYSEAIIKCTNDPNIKRAAEADPSIRLYELGLQSEELFEVWRDTYQMQTFEGLIFGKDAVAYRIEAKPLRLGNLKEFDPDDKIINQFEEILRHNNVSDKENAFNRLIALFICKLVDETNKATALGGQGEGGDAGDMLEFQYKIGTDDYETLQDRLQRLHRDGMRDFMNETVTYVEDNYAEKLFARYEGENRHKAIDDLKKTIRELKFYSNNDFAFKDVHNEELFVQNGKVLVEVVQLFQKYRIVYPSRHQLLGDLFEQLLNQGFKQNEGQFFTPIPITRFIWECIPLEEVFAHTGGSYPRIIDYACGAGHFLTEAVEAINDFQESRGAASENNDWCESSIYGVEKDYRLARVSRVSLYMNGAGRGNVVFGDGLEDYPDKIKINRGITQGSFDILTANPPYSVKAFKEHLTLKENKSLTLLDYISKAGGEIEVLFVERIKQLLKPHGIAAVILPSSILSNDSASYTQARRVILEWFNLRAIVQLGSKTFGATGTNTVVLFLQKNDGKQGEAAAQSDNFALTAARDSAAAIAGGEERKGWDESLLESWIEHIGVARQEYLDFVHESRPLDGWRESPYFGQYVASFWQSAEAASLQKANSFKKMSSEERQGSLGRAFYKQAKAVEQEKLEVFALVKSQNTLVVTAPQENAEQERFLGYTWSNRKGSEGLKPLGEGGGLLYKEKARGAAGTIAACVKESFVGTPCIPSSLAPYCKVVATLDMIDFGRAQFKNAIRTSVQSKPATTSKWPTVRLGEVCYVIRGVTYSKSDQVSERTSKVVLTADNITLDGYFDISKEVFLKEEIELPSDKMLKANDCFMCFSSGSKRHVGKVCLIRSDTQYYAGGFMAILRSDETRIVPAFLYYVLNTEQMRDTVRGTSGGSNIQNLSGSIGNLPIPLPPLAVQHEIASECALIDGERQEALREVMRCKEGIGALFADIGTSGQYPTVRLGDVCTYVSDRIAYSEIAPESYVSTDNMLQNCEGMKLYDGVPNIGSVTKYEEGDILVSNIRPYLKKVWLADKAGGCSPDVLVFRIVNDDKANCRYVYYLLKQDAFFEHMMQGKKGMKMPRGDKTQTMSYPIPLPPLAVQRALVDKAGELEGRIARAKDTAATCVKRKQAVLRERL